MTRKGEREESLPVVSDEGLEKWRVDEGQGARRWPADVGGDIKSCTIDMQWEGWVGVCKKKKSERSGIQGKRGQKRKTHSFFNSDTSQDLKY